MKNFLLVPIALAMAACAAGSKITTVQPLAPTADAPYDNVLVISLFDSFDLRRYLEREIVAELEERDVSATASTSLMDTRTPVTRQTFAKMVDAVNADAVLITQLAALESDSKLKSMNPESTYNIRPTYYFDVWSVDLEEYVEPKSLEIKHSLVLATQVYSARKREPVWGIESASKILEEFDQRKFSTVFADEAAAIAGRLSRDGLIRQ